MYRVWLFSPVVAFALGVAVAGCTVSASEGGVNETQGQATPSRLCVDKPGPAPSGACGEPLCEVQAFGVSAFVKSNGAVDGQPASCGAGQSYQCAEFVARLYQTAGLPVPYGWTSYAMWDYAVSHPNDFATFTSASPNTDEKTPRAGDFVVFNTTAHPYGHMIVIAGVTDTEVILADQNGGDPERKGWKAIAFDAKNRAIGNYYALTVRGWGRPLPPYKAGVDNRGRTDARLEARYTWPGILAAYRRLGPSLLGKPINAVHVFGADEGISQEFGTRDGPRGAVMIKGCAKNGADPANCTGSARGIYNLFYDAWQANVALVGLPTNEQYLSGSKWTQCFENGVFEFVNGGTVVTSPTPLGHECRKTGSR